MRIMQTLDLLLGYYNDIDDGPHLLVVEVGEFATPISASFARTCDLADTVFSRVCDL